MTVSGQEDELHFSFIPILLIMVGSYIVASSCLAVYSVAVDTLFLCFLKVMMMIMIILMMIIMIMMIMIMMIMMIGIFALRFATVHVWQMIMMTVNAFVCVLIIIV